MLLHQFKNVSHYSVRMIAALSGQLRHLQSQSQSVALPRMAPSAHVYNAGILMVALAMAQKLEPAQIKAKYAWTTGPVALVPQVKVRGRLEIPT